ncbi:MAG: hypothetical protein GVY32_10230 [Gammaproteobacteria bacterium]|jgi:DNA primase|nr:hypothetical protein [Gammaproteobacteria bacterium]
MSERNGPRVLKLDGRDVEISRPDKPLSPDDGISKFGLADYYARIAPIALRHYRDRALKMHRFPDGIGEEGFFQKQIGEHFPDWVASTAPGATSHGTPVAFPCSTRSIRAADGQRRRVSRPRERGAPAGGESTSVRPVS